MNTIDPYQRNIIKEGLQDCILYAVYNNSRYTRLIFTGGTCLRKSYGLNRLSEGLDFDIPADCIFDIRTFADDIGVLLKTKTRISGSGRTVFLQFPDAIFVRCDFSAVTSDEYGLQKNLVTADNRQFFVNAYDLPTLFANKIVAFLTRNFFKGTFQKTPFKGRDIYDLYWLLTLSAKTGYALKPSVRRLKALLSINSPQEIKKLVKEKILAVDAQFVYADLFPLVQSKEYLNQFLEGFEKTISDQLEYVL